MINGGDFECFEYKICMHFVATGQQKNIVLINALQGRLFTKDILCYDVSPPKFCASELMKTCLV